MPNVKSVKKYLDKHELRTTAIRKQVLTVFQNNETALCHQDIESQIDDVDRVTLYRTLQKFLEHGLIHQIEDGGQLFYALCTDCELHNHQDDHLHFKCTKCNTIKCLHQNTTIEFTLPKGYKMAAMKILLEGTCADCQ